MKRIFAILIFIYQDVFLLELAPFCGMQWLP